VGRMSVDDRAIAASLIITSPYISATDRFLTSLTNSSGHFYVTLTFQIPGNAVSEGQSADVRGTAAIKHLWEKICGSAATATNAPSECGICKNQCTQGTRGRSIQALRPKHGAGEGRTGASHPLHLGWWSSFDLLPRFRDRSNCGGDCWLDPKRCPLIGTGGRAWDGQDGGTAVVQQINLPRPDCGQGPASVAFSRPQSDDILRVLILENRNAFSNSGNSSH